jgi:hypothetical protein
MKIKSAKSFRFWFKTKIKEIEENDPTQNENFVGTYYKENGKKTIKGFFEMYHGHTPDIKGYLPSILKIAEDGQAIYEFLQNAVDCGSTHFYIFYNKKYFLAINNGSPFDIGGLQSILNIAQTTKKDPDKIGRLGIGFKLAHRLVGKNDGRDELVNQYKGPILFSWSNFEDLESLLNNDEVELSDEIQDNHNIPFLLKLLLTNFPSDPNEIVKDINYQDKVLFPQEELKELIDFLNENFQQHSEILKKNVLNQGSLFFIKLGEDKKKLLDKDYSELKNGIEYSMNTLKKLEKVYFNSDDIKKIPLQLEEGTIKQGSDEFERISPEYKEFDINFAIGFNTIEFGNKKSYEQIKLLKEKPNFYKYFPMGDEINGFGFIVHCDSFSNESNRRKLHEDDVNRNLFPELAKFVTQRLDEYKANDRNKFLNLYASLLLSDVPERQNNKWLKSIFYDVLHNYIKTNLPTKMDFSDNPQNVKINKLNPKLNLDLAVFGLNNIEWFEWDKEDDKLLIEDAKKKLGLKEWGITDIVETSSSENVNNWLSNNYEKSYKSFMEELENSSLGVKKTKERIHEIKLFKFSDGNFYSIKETISRKETNSISFKFSDKYLFINNKTKVIRNELIKLGLVVSDISVEEYPKIFGAVMPDDKMYYNLIAKWCVENANKLTADEKKKLFLNFITEPTKFDVEKDNLKTLKLFCDRENNVKQLSTLVSDSSNIPAWLNSYKIKAEEALNFEQLNSFLVQEKKLFKKIILPNIQVIKDKLTETKEIKELVTFFKENSLLFFDEYIIQKNTNGFVIIDKSDMFQIIPPKEERKTFLNFIELHLSNKLIVLPYDFSDFNDQGNNILKGEMLYCKILELVDADKHKETLVDIIQHNEPKRKFLQKLTEFKLNSETSYTKEDYEFKILDLACNVLKDSDYRSFRENIVLEEKHLSSILLFKNKIKIKNKEFSLSKILPSTDINSNLVGELISLFTRLGIPNEKLNALFGVNEESNETEIFQKIIFQIRENRKKNENKPFENSEQFLFFIYFLKFSRNYGFNIFNILNHSVYPSEFALEKEKLPAYLQDWIINKEINLSELEDIGVFTESSKLVSLRKFFLSKTDFNKNTIAEKLSSKGTMLLNTFELLKEKGIKLSSDNEFSVFKEIVRVINSNRPKEKEKELEIQYEDNFGALKEKSTEWKTINDFSVYLYKGALPKFVKLDEIQDYVFYHYNNGNFAIDNNIIYINENTDKKQTLQKVASDDRNNFSFEALWILFGENAQNTEIQSLKERNAELKNRILSLERQLPNATLTTKSSTDISKNDQNESNREAKEIVKEKLESEGFEFRDGLGMYSTISGVFKGKVEYPLVVKSYKYQDEPLKIGANELKQLIRSNSVFCLHFGNREIGYLELGKLLRTQDKLTISFSTENLDVEDRLEKFAELLQYFGNVHFDFNSVMPSKVANDFRHFNEKKNETDLSSDSDENLH